VNLINESISSVDNMRMHHFLITASELNNDLGDPHLIIFDCRFDLLHPDSGLMDYQKEHIPGARYADLNNDLAGAPTPTSGNHPLPNHDKFIEFLSRNGVDSSKQIVVYDSVGGAYAVRLWWLLNGYGHKNVAILDGGFTFWKSMNFLVDSNRGIVVPSNFHPRFNPDSVVQISEMENAIGEEDFLIIDARRPERFRGDSEPYYSKAGHIPGSINLFYQNNLDKSSRFLSKMELIALYRTLTSGRDPKGVIFYCGSGVTSLLNHFAMQMIGLKGSRVYIGSWSEWIKHHPDKIATGE
jgi:thiosulfate/3-mercaptopyruvate sulfurtransferase